MNRSRVGLLTAVIGTVMVGLGPPVRAAPPSPDELFRSTAQFDAEHHPGKALYLEHCAICHEGGVAKAPHREFLETMSPLAIITALTSGVMQGQAAGLAPLQKQQVAEYLTRTDLAHFKPQAGAVMCKGAARMFDMSKPPAAVGWGYDTHRFVPHDVAGLPVTDVAKLELKWAFAFPDTLRARSQPVVAMGAVFVGSQDGTLYAFDLQTGCARWTSKISAEIRTAVVVEPWQAGSKPAHSPRAFFGDLLGRFYAVDAVTGKPLWHERLDDHPNATITGTPLLHGDTVYVPVSSLETTTASNPAYACCTFRGSVVALDAATGRIKWRHYTIPAAAVEQGRTASGAQIMGPSGAAVWNNPAFDAKRGLIYFGSGQNYSRPADGNSDAIFAVAARTGARVWTHQVTAADIWNTACVLKTANCTADKPQDGRDFDIGASVLLIDVGGGHQVLIAGQKSGMVYAVDPDHGGELLWAVRVGLGSLLGGVHFGMAAEGSRIYVPVVDMKMQGDGSMLTDPGSPGVHALDAATGKILWHAVAANRCGQRRFCDPGVSAALTAIPGVVFAGHLDGMLRAYDGATGKVVWESDTTAPVKAVNGGMTHGGSMSGPGPAIAEGYVIVNSGYGYALHQPGNALLVYTVDGK
jgi:polyvinyl alcohol dehydrogenase (cytochrome)